MLFKTSRLVAALLACFGLLLLPSLSEGQNGNGQDGNKGNDKTPDPTKKPKGAALKIELGASAGNSVQIKAIKGKGGQTLYEIQLGGGSDQPPHHTLITGKASAAIEGKTYSGYYRLATAPKAQLRMTSKTKGTKPGTEDVYNFLAGHDILKFKFASTRSFDDPWLIATITNAQATQQVPSQDNGNQHPPIFLVGRITASTGGLAGYFLAGDSKLKLSVGGNQRLLDLTLQNTHSGMNLDNGTLEAGKK